MTELGASDAFGYLVSELGPALSQLRPANPGLQALSSQDSALWNESPYPHEAWMLTGFLFMYEHIKDENPLKAEERENLIKLLQWVHGLPASRETRESPVQRRSPSVLLKSAAKALIYEQIERMQDQESMNASDAQKMILGFFRSHMATLARAQILPPVDELQASIDEAMGLSFQTESV